LLTFVEESGVVPVEAMLTAVRQSSLGEHVPDTLLEAFE